MKIVATEMETGKAAYFDKNEIATSAELARKVRGLIDCPAGDAPTEIGGNTIWTADCRLAADRSAAIADGNQKHVIILTRPRGYIKEKQHWLCHPPAFAFPSRCCRCHRKTAHRLQPIDMEVPQA